MIKRNRVFIPKSTITLSDSTVLPISASDIMSGGLRIDDSVGDKIAIGSTIINKCSITLNNFTGKFDSYDLTGAIIRPYVGLQLSETVESLGKGVFNVDRPTVNGPIIVLEALDNMSRFDTEFSNVGIEFPCTALQLLQAVCLYCGVNLATTTFLNSTYMIQSRPDDETISCREIVSWVAQIAGCYARCNTNGSLVLDWYDFGAFESESNLDGGFFDKSNQYTSGDKADGGNFTNYSSGDNYDGGTFINMQRFHHLYSFSGEPTIGTDDIYITGIQVTDSSESPTTVLFGSSGYVLPIADNKLIQSASQATTIANSVGKKIVGMRFRSFSGKTMSDPSMEAGDIGYVSTRKGNSYPILFTSLSFSLGDTEQITCGAETPAQRYYRPTQEMKAIVESRKNTKQQLTAYDQAVRQLNDIMANAMGFYETTEVQQDGSKIVYMHDKPTIPESQIIYKKSIDGFAVSTDGGKNYTAGFDKNGNAVLNVLNAIGINANWINTGTIKGVRGEFDNGRIGKFNITNSGLENDSFKLYDADNRPWLWMHDNAADKHSTMQTVGFLQNYVDENGVDHAWFADGEKMSLSTAEDDLYTRRTYYKINEISTEGDYSITAIDGNISITSSFGSIFFMDGYANFSANGGQIQIYNDSIYIQGTDDVYINGRSVNDLFRTINSMESDIAIIKAKLNIT